MQELLTFARMADVDHDGRPLILAFDDLQWSDERSLDQMLVFLDRVAKRPVLIIATVRSVDARAENRPVLSLMEKLERQRGENFEYRVQRIGALDRAAIVRQVHELFGGSGDRQVIDWISDRAEGVPLFADEMGRLLTAAGYVDTSGRLTAKHTIDDLGADEV